MTSRSLGPHVFLSILAFAAHACGDEGGPSGPPALPMFTLAESRVDFGEVRVGRVQTTDLAVENTGSTTLALEVVRETEADSPIDATLGRSAVVAGGRADLTVRFAPSASGPVTARFTLRVVGGDPSSPTATLEVTGTGTEPMGVASPTRLAFPAILPGTTATLALGLENTGLEAVDVEVLPTTNVDRCGFMAQNPSPFCVDVPENATVPLAVGARTDVRVTYRPTVAAMDPDQGALTVRFCRSSSMGCVYEIELEGATTSEDLVCGPAALEFGALNPGSCAGLNVDCENRSNLPVSMVRAELTAMTAPEFTLQGMLPSTVAPGASAQVSLLYCPTAEGAHTGGLIITSTREGRGVRQDTFPLSGQGGGPDILATRSLDFGTVSTLAPARRVLQVQNQGTEALEVSQVSFEGVMGAMWRVVNPLPLVVAPSGLGLLELEVQAVDEGPRQVTAQLMSNDRDTPSLSVSLESRGALLPPCQYAVDLPDGGAPIQLSAQVDGTATRNLTFTNTGQSDCQVTAIELRGGASASLELVGTNLRSHTVRAGGTSPITIRYRPTAPGMGAAELFIGASSPSQPFTTRAVQATAAP